MMSSATAASAAATDAEGAALDELAVELLAEPAAGAVVFAFAVAGVVAALGVGGAGVGLHAANAMARRRRTDSGARGSMTAILRAVIRVTQPARACHSSSEHD